MHQKWNNRFFNFQRNLIFGVPGIDSLVTPAARHLSRGAWSVEKKNHLNIYTGLKEIHEERLTNWNFRRKILELQDDIAVTVCARPETIT